jgi:hypothetical protein
MILPNGQTVPVQKQGPNVTVPSQNDLYALGGIGGAPLLPPRVVDSDDTYARIVDAIYSSTPADKVLSIPMESMKASGSPYVRGFLGPAHLNPAYGMYGSPSLLSGEYGDPRLLAEYRSHDGLSFAASTGEANLIRQASSGSASQPASPQIARSVSENEPIIPEKIASSEGNEQKGETSESSSEAKVHGAYGPLPVPSGAYGPLPVRQGAYGSFPGQLLLRPMLDQGFPYMLDAETGYRSRVFPSDQYIYVRDPESGYRMRVLGPAPAPSVSYVYDPESGVRMRTTGARGGLDGPGREEQPSSSGTEAASAKNTNEPHSGDSHDSQSSTASGASSSTPLASASVPVDIRPSAPRLGYAADQGGAAASPEVADVPTVIRRYNADTGEEYIYTLAVSRLPRTNVDR